MYDWLAGSFNTSTSQLENSLSYNLNPGIEYNLVIAGFSASFPSSLPQNYLYSYSGPGNCISGEVAPIGFDYNYVIINSGSNNIVEITSTPNLMSYSGGTYTLYGLSVDQSTDLSPYMGSAFSSLEDDLLDLTICGSISSNLMEINHRRQ